MKSVAKTCLFIPRIAGNRYRSGSIREAGGAFGKLEASREGAYFYKLQHEQLKKLKKNLKKGEIEQQADPIASEEGIVEPHKK